METKLVCVILRFRRRLATKPHCGIRHKKKKKNRRVKIVCLHKQYTYRIYVHVYCSRYYSHRFSGRNEMCHGVVSINIEKKAITGHVHADNGNTVSDNIKERKNKIRGLATDKTSGRRKFSYFSAIRYRTAKEKNLYFSIIPLDREIYFLRRITM